MEDIINASMEENKALGIQVGGSHYRKYAIQPVEFIERNNLSFCQGNIVKYVCRYKDKNGIQDLLKARHYIDILIEIEQKYGKLDGKFQGKEEE